MTRVSQSPEGSAGDFHNGRTTPGCRHRRESQSPEGSAGDFHSWASKLLIP